LNLKKLLNYLSILSGGTITLLGVAFVLIYVWEGVVPNIGKPDQSPIFWYLPIFFLGLFGIFGGVALMVIGINSKRNIKRNKRIKNHN